MAFIDSIQQSLGSELAQMNSIISQTLATPNQLMNSVVTGYLRTKGKQIRPIMVLLSAKMFGAINEEALYAAAALEMLHNATLIHDDVVDDTALRRGVPTINSTMGNHLAGLVGDYFVSNALAAGIKTGNVTIVAALSALGKELSLGEIDQICNVREHRLDEQSYFNMIMQKTASLFRNCVRMGAEAVGAVPQQYEALMRYAELLGLCFQIKDDIFDYFSDPAIGKPTGNDLREGKVTLPLIYALNGDDSEAAEMRALLQKGIPDDRGIARLIAFARERGGIEYAYSTMRRMQQEGEALLSSYGDNAVTRTFADIFDFIIRRNH